MKRAGIALGLAGLLASSAHAADLGPGWVVPPAASYGEGEYNWSGLYYGAFAGGVHSMWTIDFYRNNNHGHADVASDGFAAGALVGYNWQYSRHVVVGLEADLGWSNASQHNQVFDNDHTDSSLGMFGSVRARAGYAMGRLMLFATAGLAFADISQNIQKGRNAGEQVVWDNQSPTGWIIGGGVEYAFTDHWLGRLEYQHANFGSVSLINADGNLAIFQNDMNLLRVALAYKF